MSRTAHPTKTDKGKPAAVAAQADKFDPVADNREATFDYLRRPPELSSVSMWSPASFRRVGRMKKRFTDAQIVGFLREVDAGEPVKGSLSEARVL